MPVDLIIDGAEQLGSLAKALRDAGDKGLRQELYRGINRATKPLKQAAKDSARQNLPKRGGLNEFVAASKFTTSTRGGGKNVGVSIKAKKAGHDVRSIDRGRLRHPVFGKPGTWVDQAVTPGWFTKPLQAGASMVRRELVDVIESVAKQLSRKG